MSHSVAISLYTVPGGLVLVSHSRNTFLVPVCVCYSPTVSSFQTAAVSTLSDPFFPLPHSLVHCHKQVLIPSLSLGFLSQLLMLSLSVWF